MPRPSGCAEGTDRLQPAGKSAPDAVAPALGHFASVRSRSLADRFALLAVEDLNLRAMLRSARGTVEEPGTNVAQKRGLNREIADQGWGQFIDMLAYKAEEAGGRVVRVDPRGSSQTCSEWELRDARSRRGAVFRCVACGHTADADTNAARVLLARALKDQGPGRGLQAPTDALASVA